MTDVETLTDLVAARVGRGRSMTYRRFEELAIDPDTGYQPSRDTLWKISHGKPIKVDAAIVRAVAAALNLPVERAQRAAAYQYLGLLPSGVAGGIVLHRPEVEAATSSTEEEVRRQQQRAAEDGG
ncbi:hypothetical protein [Streptomyces sp. NPDC002547]